MTDNEKAIANAVDEEMGNLMAYLRTPDWRSIEAWAMKDVIKGMLKAMTIISPSWNYDITDGLTITQQPKAPNEVKEPDQTGE